MSDPELDVCSTHAGNLFACSRTHTSATYMHTIAAASCCHGLATVGTSMSTGAQMSTWWRSLSRLGIGTIARRRMPCGGLHSAYRARLEADRSNRVYGWFARSLMVFHRRTRPPGCVLDGNSRLPCPCDSYSTGVDSRLYLPECHVNVTNRNLRLCYVCVIMVTPYPGLRVTQQHWSL